MEWRMRRQPLVLKGNRRNGNAQSYRWMCGDRGWSSSPGRTPRQINRVRPLRGGVDGRLAIQNPLGQRQVLIITSEETIVATTADLKIFAEEFRDGLIGTQPKASRGMCALVSIPLRAALKVLRGVETTLVTEDGHTFLVTSDGQYRIDPTIDQFGKTSEKVLVQCTGERGQTDERLIDLPFIELIENFKRLYGSEDRVLGPREAGGLVAQFIFYPLARRGFFEGRME